MADQGDVARYRAMAARLRDMASKEKNLSARPQLLAIATSLDELAVQAKKDARAERVQMVARQATLLLARRQQLLVTRLRQVASEHKNNPRLAADFARTADTIEAGRAPGSRPKRREKDQTDA